MIHNLLRPHLLSSNRLHASRGLLARQGQSLLRLSAQRSSLGSLLHSRPFSEQPVPSAPNLSVFSAVKNPVSWKHVLVGALTGFFVYVMAAEESGATTDDWSSMVGTKFTVLGPRQPTTIELRRAVQLELGAKLQSIADAVGEFTERPAVPFPLKRIIRDAYVWGANHWIAANDGRRAAYIISAANIGVYILWQIPRLRPFMHLHFTHNPLSGRTYTLLTSMFSHNAFWHLAMNTIALTSFSAAASHWMVQEQIRRSHNRISEATSTYHFLAVYICAGLAAGLVSHTVQARFLYPRLVKQLATVSGVPAKPSLLSRLASQRFSMATGAAAHDAPATVAHTVRDITGSLGASGAIYALVVLTALASPDERVQIVFLPFWDFNIQSAVGALVLLDVIGVLRGWRSFDHFAHLGGAAFGALYFEYGMSCWLRCLTAHKSAKKQIEEEKKWRGGRS